VYTYSEIVSSTGHIGNFEVTLRRHPRYVEEDRCTACGKCAVVCPVSVPDEFEFGMAERTAIYLPHANAVPRKYLIDNNACTQCYQCEDACTAGAINHKQEPETITIKGDCIIVATGYELFDAALKQNYGFGKYKNVVHAMQLERMIVPIGPTKGRFIRVFSDKKEIKRIGIVQCVGARDEQVGRINCSRICCMYGIKHAIFVKKKIPDADVYLFYTDIRAFGKGYEEYYKNAQNAGVKFIRGRVAEIYETENGNPVIRVEDTLSHRLFELECDLVSLSASIMPHNASEKLAHLLRIQKDSEGFFLEAHPKYRPVDTRTAGIFICGCAQGPKDIPDTVAQAGAAASSAMSHMGTGKIPLSPIKAFVSEACDGCGQCVDHCPSSAISLNGNAVINEILCDGCGACISSCPQDALNIRHFTTGQIMSMVAALLANKKGVTVVAFADKTTTYRVLDSAGQQRIQYPPGIYSIRVADASQITPKMILETFRLGADGVFLGEPEAGSSIHHPKTIEVMVENVKKAKKMLEEAGIEPDRLDYGLYITVWAQKLAGQLKALEKRVNELGKLPDETIARLMEVNQ
jgi:heterodisulfide reductase subunit A